MAGNFNDAWGAFFGEGVKEGTVVDLGNGAKVTKMGDGTAVYQDSTGAWVQYDKNSDPSKVASQATGLAQDWGKSYGAQAPISQPFSNVEEFKAWEAQNLGGRASIDKFNPNYQAPDYIRQMGAAVGGGNEEAFNRFLFFKNNPQFVEDYKNIHNGQLSKFATDGSTLQRTDMSQLTPEARAYYEQNPGQLNIAEGFNMDPNLYASRMGGGFDRGKNFNYTGYMQANAMDAQGNIAASNNAVKAAQWAQSNPNYNVNLFDTNTGGIIDNGRVYDSRTGQPIFTSTYQDQIQAEELAKQGRNGDTTVAHLTPGEVVIPKELAVTNPALYQELMATLERLGSDPSKRIVGNGRINPRTGIQEFASEDEVKAAYQSVLGRAPDAAEVSWWSSNSGGGNFMDSFKAAAQSEIASRPTTTSTPTTTTSTSTSTPTTSVSTPTTTSSTGSGGGATTSTPSSTWGSTDVSNIYRNVFGRDAEQAGIDYWTNYAKQYGNEQAYNALTASGKGIGENTKNLSYAEATKAYQGPAGGSVGTSTIDEWFWNVLGRAPTDAERANYKTGSIDEAKNSYAAFQNWAKAQQGYKGDMSIAQASQLYGNRPPQITPGTGSNGMPTTGITLEQIQGTTPWNIDANQTVAGQLAQILANDSPLMQQARARALQQMNSRGLVNSSMAQSAADSAMYDQAMQIAQQDASTYADSGRFNADASNTFSRDNNAFVRDAFMADFNLAANDWLAERNFQREYQMLDKTQQQELERMAVANGYQNSRDMYMNEWQIARDNYMNQFQIDRDKATQEYQKELERIRQQYQTGENAINTDITTSQYQQQRLDKARSDISNANAEYANKLAGIYTSGMTPEAMDNAIEDLAKTYNQIIKSAVQVLGWKFEDWDIEVTPRSTTPSSGGGSGGSGGSSGFEGGAA